MIYAWPHAMWVLDLFFDRVLTLSWSPPTQQIDLPPPTPSHQKPKMATASAPAGTRLPEGARNGVFPQPIPGAYFLGGVLRSVRREREGAAKERRMRREERERAVGASPRPPRPLFSPPLLSSLLSLLSLPLGIKILPPLGRPPAGAQPVGYAMVDPEPGCLKCSTLSQAGIIVVILLAIFFWPLAFLPCLFPQMHEKAQRAMYAVPEAPVAAKF